MVTFIVAEPVSRPYAALGQRIAELRHRAGLSQRELARHVAISIGYLPKIESGRNRPDALILRRIAVAVSVPYADLAVLAGYQDSPPPEGEDMRLTPDEASLIRTLRERIRVPVRRVCEVVLSLYHADDELFYDIAYEKDAQRRVIDGPEDEARG